MSAPAPLPDLQLRELGGRSGSLAQQLQAALQPLARLRHPDAVLRPLQFRQRDARRAPQPLLLPRGAHRLDLRQLRVLGALAAQVGVGGPRHGRQPLGRVGGDEPQPLRPGVVVEEGGERAVEGLDSEAVGLELVEHAVLGVDPGGERMGAQDRRAEAVDRRDEGALGGARLGVQVGGGEAVADARLQLGGGLLGEGDREDRVDRDAVLDHRAGEPLDEHRGLARAGAGGDQQAAVAALDRPQLLVGEVAPAHRSILQIEGCEQPPR